DRAFVWGIDVCQSSTPAARDISRCFHAIVGLIILNGEIYNYRELREQLSGKGHVFRTQADTEVLLAAWAEWGSDCLAKLDGMFAFALWDDRERSLFLVRDHVGIKPLYYVACQKPDREG